MSMRRHCITYAVAALSYLTRAYPFILLNILRAKASGAHNDELALIEVGILFGTVNARRRMRKKCVKMCL